MLSGQFNSFDLPPLAGGAAWQIDYSGGAVTISVPATAPTNNTLKISGVLTNTQGAPIAGATVYAYVDSAVQPDLIVNGSFETPGNAGADYVLYPAGSTNIPGWTIIGPGTAGPFGWLSRTGAGRFAILRPDRRQQRWRRHFSTYPTVPGVAYKLIFFHGAHSLYGGISLGVTNNGVLLFLS